MGDDIKQIIVDWIQYLKTQKLYSNHDPVFPMSELGIDEQQQFKVKGIKSAHWSSAAPIREIFKQAFKQAGLEYFNPHSFRNALTQLGQTRCKTPEAFKAWSQNLGHESVLTTLYSYGQVSLERQAALIKEPLKLQSNLSIDDIADILAEKFMEKGLIVKI